MKRMVKVFLLYLSIFLLFSCSCEKKMIRLTYRCPHLFETKIIRDTTFIPEFRFDTLNIFSKGITDTITITKDRVEIKFVRVLDTLKTYIHVPGDTIIKEIPVEVPVPVMERRTSFLDRIFIGIVRLALLGGALYLAYSLLIERRKNKKKIENGN